MIEIKDKTLAKMSFIDLFAGIGGFRLSLSSLGANCVYSNEWDKYAQQTYSQNFNETPDGDITKIDANLIPDHDILCAGFPCQAFSISGKQKGFEDSRGTLFFDVARIIKAKQPKVVLMENVKNFATHDNKNTLAVVKKTMEELGYDFYFQVLNATDYNVAQKRERIYMVGFRKDLKVDNFDFPAPLTLTKHVKDYLVPDHEVLDKYYVSRSDIYLNSNVDYQQTKKPIRIGTVNKGGQGERIYSIEGTGITLSSYGGGVFAKTGGYLINNRYRRLTPRECARLMGYPDWYQLHPNDNQAYQQLGNSVVVDVLQYIAIEIAKKLTDR